MKVLHVGEYVKGGVSTYINELLSFQKCNSYIEDVYLLLSQTNSENNFVLPPDRVIYYKYTRSLFRVLTAIISIKKWIDYIKPDIIHCHSSFAGFMVRCLYFFTPKKYKIVYSPHAWSFMMDISPLKKKIYAMVERILSRRTDLIIASSQLEYKAAEEYNMPIKKCILIHNGLSQQRNEEVSTLEFNPDPATINMLFVGRFDKQKGIDILINTYKKYLRDNIKLYLIGNSVLGNLDIKIPDGVENLGWIEYSKLDYYIKKCDVIIIPSRWEGFGLIALDAFRNKKAVVASRCGAFPEIVIHGSNGYLFDINNQDELLEILANLDKNKLTEMGIKGYDTFRNKYSAEAMNRNIVNEYKELLTPKN